jgi:hypothetical protein
LQSGNWPNANQSQIADYNLANDTWNLFFFFSFLQENTRNYLIKTTRKAFVHFTTVVLLFWQVCVSEFCIPECELFHSVKSWQTQTQTWACFLVRVFHSRKNLSHQTKNDEGIIWGTSEFYLSNKSLFHVDKSLGGCRWWNNLNTENYEQFFFQFPFHWEN